MQKQKPQWCLRSLIVVAILIFAAGGCSDDNPTQPAESGNADLTLSSAMVSVADQSLDGEAIQQGDHAGPVRYEARLTDHHGNPVTDGRVLVRYGMSGMMEHMQGYMHMGEFYCFDDGTHGDPIPGDGIYCFVDGAQQYGCHRASARPGEYRYEFCGFDQHGHQSNLMNVTVTLLP